MQNELNILVVGASGPLGQAIVNGLIYYKNVTVWGLVKSLQSSDQNTSQAISHFQSKGVKLIEGSIDDRNSLSNATRGADVVISAVGEDEGDEVVAKGQIALAEVSIENRVKVFIPSPFGLYDENLSVDEFPIIKARRQVLDFLDSKGPQVIKYTQFNTGLFYEAVEKVFGSKDGDVFEYYSSDKDKTQRIQLTSLKDTGRFVAAAVHDPSRWPGLPKYTSVTGQLGNTIQILESQYQALGINKPFVSVGKLDDAYKLFKQALESNDPVWRKYEILSVYPSDKTTPPGYQNGNFPEVLPESYREYLIRLGGHNNATPIPPPEVPPPVNPPPPVAPPS